jgi:hypothetical protein
MGYQDQYFFGALSTDSTVFSYVIEPDSILIKLTEKHEADTHIV